MPKLNVFVFIGIYVYSGTICSFKWLMNQIVIGNIGFTEIAEISSYCQWVSLYLGNVFCEKTSQYVSHIEIWKTFHDFHYLIYSTEKAWKAFVDTLIRFIKYS